MTDDAELLRQYAEEGSDRAFAELVSRRLGLVYAAALRQVGRDAEAAKDVAQTVFIDLARKAGSLWRREVLTGWLYTSTRYAAANLARKERRRQNREQALAAMQTDILNPGAEPDWRDLSPCLDDAMAELSPGERNAVLLRFFNRQELKAVGAALGISEDAARMRVNRALESLRSLLQRRGVTLSTAALAAALTGEAITAAPAGLAAGIAGTALASAGAGGVLSLSLLKPMLLTKLKVALVGSAVVVGVATPLWLQHQSQNKLRQENEALQQQLEQLRAANEQRSPAPGASAEGLEQRSRQSELLRLRGEVNRLKRDLTAATNRNVQPGPALVRPSDASEEEPQLLTTQHELEVRVSLGGTFLTAAGDAGNGKQVLLFTTPRLEGNQIVVHCDMFEAPESVLASLGLGRHLSESAISSPSQMLGTEKAQGLVKELTETEGVTMLCRPTVSTTSGQQASIGIGETRVLGGKTNLIGQTLDILPTLSEDQKSVAIKLGMESSKLVKAP